MRFPIWPLLAFLPLFNFGWNAEALSFKSLKRQANENETSMEDEKSKQVAFDNQGVLVINGTISGRTEPIVVDRKPLPKFCNIKPYYIFSVCPENLLKLAKNKTVCPEGITFCYEGQLAEGKVLDQYLLPKVKNEIAEKCREFNGFKLAIRYLPNNRAYKGNDYLFLQVRTSFMDESYYFPLPDSKCADLAMGNLENLMAGIRTMENKNELVAPVEVILDDGTKDGISYEDQESFLNEFFNFPDVTQMRFRDNPHMNMLYVDFRAVGYAAQMMMAMIPEQCNMIVRIRSNVVKACKSDFKQKNFALRAYGDNSSSTEYALTIESGTEEWNTKGSKSGRGKTITSGQETSSSTIDESSSLSGLQKETEHTDRHSNQHTDSSGSGTVTEGGASLSGQAGVSGSKGNFDLEAKGQAAAGVQYMESNGNTDTNTKWDATTNSHSTSTTTITSNLNIMQRSYKQTSTSINTQQQNRMQSETVGITKRTVKVPPGKILTPMQMTMNCDGQSVKIPWIKFVLSDDGDDDLPVTDY